MDSATPATSTLPRTRLPRGAAQLAAEHTTETFFCIYITAHFPHRLLGIEPDSSECISQQNNENPRQAPESRSSQLRLARWPRIFAQPFCTMFAHFRLLTTGETKRQLTETVAWV